MPKHTQIDGSDADFFFNHRERLDEPPPEMVVTSKSDRFRQVRDTGVDPFRRYEASLGAHTDPWMDEEGGFYGTPEGIFAIEFIAKSKHRGVTTLALREIGKIKECEWARIMIRALDHFERNERGE